MPGEYENSLEKKDYEYDVFISYQRDPPVGPFVTTIFIDLFRAWLGQHLAGRTARVFLDQSAVLPGDCWPERLSLALQTSRCLVAICSPGYFRSPWCLSEWESFRARERLSRTEGLIVPMRHNDGQYFPDDARRKQMRDFTQFRTSLPVFLRTEAAVEFERAVSLFAEEVALRIDSAPPFRPDWPVVTGKPAEEVIATPLLRLGSRLANRTSS